MKNTTLTIAVLLAASAAQAQTQWQAMAGSGTGGDIGTPSPVERHHPVVAMDPQGYPVIAWEENISSQRIHLKKGTASGWVELGGSCTGDGVSGSTNYAMSPAIAVDPATSDIYVAWNGQISGSGRCAYLRRWRASLSKWEGLAGSDMGQGISGNVNTATTIDLMVALALDGQGRPTVAYPAAEYWYAPTEIRVKSWNGTAWVELAGSAGAAGISASPDTYSAVPSIAINAQGKPTVAWAEETETVDIYVRTWDGQSWADMDGSSGGGGVSATLEESYYPSLMLDVNGNPIVAWVDYGNDAIVLAKAWDGRVWQSLGLSAIRIDEMDWDRHGMTLRPDVAGAPTVCYPTTGGRARVRRWDGTTWTIVGAPDTVDGASTPIDEPCVGAGNRGLGVSFVTYSGSWQIRYREYNDIVPPAFTAMSQEDGGESVPAGARLIGKTTVAIEASYTASLSTVRLDVEIKPLGTTFNGAVTASDPGAPLRRTSAVTVTGLSPAQSFHWRARLTDNLGQTTGWIAFGNNPETAEDFRTEINIAPPAAQPEQRSGGLTLAAGREIYDREAVRFESPATDPNGRRVRFEIELRPVGEAFRGQATGAGPFVPSGATAAVELTPDQGAWRWQGRVTDEDGASSAWQAFAGGAAAFQVIQAGSIGKACAGSATGAGALPIIVLALAALGGRPRRAK